MGHPDVKSALKSISNLIDDDDLTTFTKLKQFINNTQITMPLDTLFINRSDIYALFQVNTNPVSDEFKRWISNEVLHATYDYAKHLGQQDYYQETQSRYVNPNDNNENSINNQ